MQSIIVLKDLNRINKRNFAINLSIIFKEINMQDSREFTNSK